VALDIKAILEPERAEFLLAELACEEAPGLVAELCDALVYEALVDVVVAVHKAHSVWRRFIITKTN